MSLRVPDSDPFLPENPPTTLLATAKQTMDDDDMYDVIQKEEEDEEDEETQGPAIDRIKTEVKLNPDNRTNLKEVTHSNVIIAAKEEKKSTVAGDAKGHKYDNVDVASPGQNKKVGDKLAIGDAKSHKYDNIDVASPGHGKKVGDKSTFGDAKDHKYKNIDMTSPGHGTKEKLVGDKHEYDDVNITESSKEEKEVAKPKEPMYHVLEQDQSMSTDAKFVVDKSSVGIHVMVVPKIEHMYNTLDDPRQSKQDKPDKSKILHNGVEDAEKKPLNSCRRASDFDPKYDEPMLPNRVLPQRTTHLSSPPPERITPTKSKLLFDDPAYANSFNPPCEPSIPERKAITVRENRPDVPLNPHPRTKSLVHTPSESRHHNGSNKTKTNIEMEEVSEPEVVKETPPIPPAQKRGPKSRGAYEPTCVLEPQNPVFDDPMYDIGLNLNIT